MSRCLSELGIEHVVIERGKVAERWRSQSWDSLRLLTPNWMTRLPGFQYDGADASGFMSVPELIALFERYAASSRAPVEIGTTVRSVERAGDRFRVATDRGVWSTDSVVVATGYCYRPAVPAASRALAPSVTQVVPADYRRPEQLPAGGVLIVGASSTGVQLADEIQQSGRQVTLAVGRHTRLLGTIAAATSWWLDRLGMSESADAVRDIHASRQQPSLQLVGRPDRSSLDLAILHERGVRVVAGVRDLEGHDVSLADDLIATTAAADIKMAEILTRIDRFIVKNGLPALPHEPFRPTWPLATDLPGRLDLKAEGIATVISATGCRRAYPWLHVPVLDARGEIIHEGGITPRARTRRPGHEFPAPEELRLHRRRRRGRLGDCGTDWSRDCRVA
jgi:putative flavoprotein involved in K+ transport